MNLLQLAKDYNEVLKEEKSVKERKDALKKEIVEAVGNKSFKNAFMTVTVTAPTTVETIDVEKMKIRGIYPEFIKISERKGSEKITVKEKELEALGSGSVSGLDFVPERFGQEKEDINGIPDDDDDLNY